MSERVEVALSNTKTAPESYGWTHVVSEIASAYAARDATTVAEILELVDGLLKTLDPIEANRANIGASAPSPAPTATTSAPAVPIESAVQKDKVTCLCCGVSFTMLKRHLKAEHGLTEDEYRSMYSLPDDMPLVAPSYSERKAEYARTTGLGKHTRDTNIQAKK